MNRSDATWAELVGFGLAGVVVKRRGVPRPPNRPGLALVALARHKTPVATLVTRETRITHSGLGVRARRVARRLGAETVGELAAAAARLRKTRGCGKRTEAEILKLLEAI